MTTMEKKTTDRIVRTHLDNNGIIIFSLLQGRKKPRTVHTFGYGTRHKIWLKVEGLGSGTVTMTAEPVALVKEKIAQWGR
jgi:hypothetical protein